MPPGELRDRAPGGEGLRGLVEAREDRVGVLVGVGQSLVGARVADEEDTVRETDAGVADVVRPIVIPGGLMNRGVPSGFV